MAKTPETETVSRLSVSRFFNTGLFISTPFDERIMTRTAEGITAGSKSVAKAAADAASAIVSQLGGRVSIPACVTTSRASARSGVMSSGSRPGDDALLRRALTAATRAASGESGSPPSSASPESSAARSSGG